MTTNTTKIAEAIGLLSEVLSNEVAESKHFIDEDDIQSVVDVLRHGALTQGPKIAEFENKVADYVGAKYAVAVANGTAALHLACMALELGEGDEVITSPNTFVATSNSVLYVGAKPIFIDIDKRTLNLDSLQIEKTVLSVFLERTRPIFHALFTSLTKAVEMFDGRDFFPKVYLAVNTLDSSYHHYQLRF